MGKDKKEKKVINISLGGAVWAFAVVLWILFIICGLVYIKIA